MPIFATVIPIALALTLGAAAFMVVTGVMIRTHQRWEVNESPLAAEFWDHDPQRIKRAADHPRPTRPRHSGIGSLPKIHFLTYDQRDPIEYALPDAYSLAGITRSTR